MTPTAPAGVDDLDDTARTRIIRREIQQLGDWARERHRWLAHQDAIGAGLLLVSAAAILANAVLYGSGRLSAWLVVPLSAFFMSILHELEHDLIHRLYFRRHRPIHHAMMACVWLFRPSTINPWVRRALHHHHHRVSGTESDLEERSLTNGEPWSWRRLLMTADGMLAIYLRPLTIGRMVRAYVDAQRPASPEARRALIRAARLSYVPLGTLHFTVWHAFILFQMVSLGAMALGHPLHPVGLAAQVIRVVEFLVVVWLSPNVLRSFCLYLVTSNIHYYGDVEEGNILRQTQVWNRWWLLPLQIFCFNFGSTHAIHHFVVRDPFYLRQLIAPQAHRVLRAYGVRFNDFGTFRRANRWSRARFA
jgi:hypothetical protein